MIIFNYDDHDEFEIFMNVQNELRNISVISILFDLQVSTFNQMFIIYLIKNESESFWHTRWHESKFCVQEL